MTLSEIKSMLPQLDQVIFELPNGELVPPYFHVTEVGKVTKNFIDCGGTIRKDEKVSFQLWYSTDYNHRLHPEKLQHIIELSENKLQIDENHEVEVEYQGNSIETYDLEFSSDRFHLKSKFTDCLAKEKCDIPVVKSLEVSNSQCCTPAASCC